MANLEDLVWIVRNDGYSEVNAEASATPHWRRRT